MKILLGLLLLLPFVFGGSTLVCKATTVEYLDDWDSELVESWQDLQVYMYTNTSGNYILTLWGPEVAPLSYIGAGGSENSGCVHRFTSNYGDLDVEGTLTGIRVTPLLGDDTHVSIAFSCSQGL